MKKKKGFKLELFHIQRTVHNVIESDDGQVLWMGSEIDMGLLTEDQDGGDITTEENSSVSHVPSTSSSTRTVHIPVSGGLMVKKEVLNLLYCLFL